MAQARIPHPKALPNYQNAVIPRSKLEDYALNPAHTDGQHKARLFRSILGFERRDWKLLSDAILDELPFHEAIFNREDGWGKYYLVSLPIKGPNGNSALVTTIWIIKPRDDYASFVTPRDIKEVR
jgi:filamentous hemagglutinin